jgi:hypothetical protein
MLYSWLQRIQDKANTCSWTSILTRNGSLLTEKYAEISLEEVRRHAQAYQNVAIRNAQNVEQLIICLKGSITKDVHTRIYQLRSKYIISREPDKEVVQDGVCYLKVIIEALVLGRNPKVSGMSDNGSEFCTAVRADRKGRRRG